MKGIVFTEFLDMVEQRFGLETVDKIISTSKLESKGIYTSVGTYNFVEMQELLSKLGQINGMAINELIYEYGKHFFGALTKHYPDIFDLYDDPMLLLASIESHIHVHVKKIYPDAELPTFDVLVLEKNHMELLYTSERAMYMFAKALMEKTFEHYKGKATIDYEKIKEDGTQVKFMIKTNDGQGKQ